MTLTVTRDNSTFINASIGALEEHLLWGSFFAAVVVMLFMRNLRAVLIASLAIPASIISTFTLMRAMGFTLNNMTLLGITLAVGIVIDDAIVVLENIFRYIEEKNCTPFEAAIQGTREVALAVMATTLSLVVIFLPVAFMTGYARKFINPFGWTMAFSIMVSMLVSFTLTPMLSSRFLKLSDAAADHKTKESGFFHWLDNWYTGWVTWSLDHPGIIIGTSVVVFLMTFPLNRMVGRTFVPVEDMGEWTIHIDVPEGTSLEGQLGDRQAACPGDGRHSRHRRDSTGDARAAEPHSSHLLRAAIRRAVGDRGRDDRRDAPAPPEAPVVPLRDHAARRPRRERWQLRDQREPAEPGPGTPDRLFDAAAEEGAGDVVDHRRQDDDPGAQPGDSRRRRSPARGRSRRPHLDDRQRASPRRVRRRRDLDVSRGGGAVSGEDPRARKPAARRGRDRQADGAVGDRRARSGSTTSRASNAALGPTTLSRFNRQFAVQLQASVAPGHALDEASNETRQVLADLHLPPDMSYKLTGQTKILDETTTNLIMAVGLAMIFVYIVLAAQFESFIQPIVIMLVLPLSMPFALFTLWATGRTLNLWSALGVLLLLGIVKKNSILQVDYANVLRAKGMPLREAIVEACRTRLRPILMTTLAIIAGLVPTALGLGIGGHGRAAIAVTVIGGQSLCLFLTLLLVPVAYVKFDAFENVARQRAAEELGREIHGRDRRTLSDQPRPVR